MKLYQHDSPAAFQMVLKGDLGEVGAQGVRWAWETARSILGAKELVVDVSDVTAVYPSGIDLLRRMREHGAHIAAERPLRCAELSELLDRRAPPPQPQHPILRMLRFIIGLRSCG
jgi:hypothetical protein